MPQEQDPPQPDAVDHGVSPPGESTLGALLAELEADEHLRPATSAAIRSSLPGYDGVSAPSLEASIDRNLALSLRTLRAGRAPAPEEIEEAEALALERMEQGVPIGSVLAGFRICMREILRTLHELAPAHGLSPETVLSFSTLLWSLGDAFSTRAVQVHQERSVARAVADSARRARWIVDAVVSGLPRTELLAGATAYGIPADVPVRALLVARHAPASGVTSAVQRWVERAGAQALIAPHGDADVGLVIGDPDPEEPLVGVTAALGPAVALEELPESFATAGRVLETAQRLDRDGVSRLEDLSWRMGITASPETTALLRRRHLDPLEAEGSFSEFLLEAVRAYLAHGLSIPRAAESIPVHVNTLRYRLRRFQELTATDLHDPEDLIEVTWALAAHPHLEGEPPHAAR